MKRSDSELEDTLADPTRATEPRDAAAARTELEGYELGDVIGRGGMGEVMLARDLQLGRDVAIKRMRSLTPSDESIVRFLREAKIQARLDHPAIVPVHELGHDAQGKPYFTMKHITGVTLAALVERGTESRQRLLRAFVDVAMAIDLAHSKGIVHRDLKPANIMLGEYGEVHVLDWGLARDIHDPTSNIAYSTVATPLTGVTALGSILGTPGYMPPEQITDASTVGAAADSYALGAILFEVLTGMPLHGREDPISSTLEGVDASPSRRCPDREIPPELDQLCVAAITEDQTRRPTARALADHVQSYLDGDRDLAMRRAVASEAVATARTALAGHRQDEAMRAAGRALALDPSSEAADIVTRLMLEQPKDPPLRAELEAVEAMHTTRHAKRAMVMWLTVPPLVAIAIANGIRSWELLLSIALLAVVLSIVVRWIGHHPSRSNRELWAYAVGNAMMIGMLGRLCSPFIIAPSAACLVIMSIVAYPTLTRRGWLVASGIVAGWLVPVVLELLGLVRPTWEFSGNLLTIRSYAIDYQGSLATLFVFVTTSVVFITAGFLAVSVARANHAAERQLLTQRWQLGHLIPAS